MKLHRPDTKNTLAPTDEIIHELVEHTGWIPLTRLYVRDRMEKTGLNIRAEEIPFIHPKNLCILRIKHEMAVAMISGKPGDRIIRLNIEAVRKIDEELGGIINPHGGGFTSAVRDVYGKDPTFTELAMKHRKALDVIEKIMVNGPFPELWLFGLPYFKKDTNWFGKADLRTELSRQGNFPREDIVLIKLSPPSWVDGLHGGRANIFIKSQESADKLLKTSISIEGKEGKMFEITIRPAEATKASKIEPKEFKDEEEW